jgi:lipopolysaccharide exporter
MSDLAAKTLHGLKWTNAATVANIALQLILSAILARLLTPQDFGLVAMALVVLNFGTFFSQLGVGRALIQKASLSAEEVRAGFTSSLFLGSLMTAIVFFLAPLVGRFYQTPDVVPILRVLSLSFIINGLSVTATSLLRRQFRFRVDSIAEVLSYLFGYGAIGIPLALAGYGVWSLVFATLSQALLTALIAYGAVRHDLRPIFGWYAYKPLYHFGSRVSLISIFEFIGYNLDTILIGRLASASALGLYNRAYLLARLPLYRLATSITKVLFPSFSQLQLEPLRFRSAYVLSLSLASAFIMPVAFGMAAASEELVRVLLGEQWTGAIPILQLLAVGMPASLLTHFSGVACEALAVLRAKLLLQVGYIACLAVLFWQFQGYGILGFAAALGVAEIGRHLAYIVLTRRVMQLSKAQLYQAYIPALMTGAFTGLAIHLVALLGRHLAIPSVLLLLLEVAVGALCLALAAFVGPLNATLRSAADKFLPASSRFRHHPLIQRHFGLGT